SRRRHTRCYRDWSSDVCSSDLRLQGARSPSGRPQQFWQVETFEESEVLRDSAPGQVRHRGGGGVVPPSVPRLKMRGATLLGPLRSEERRVGKDCSGGWLAGPAM